MTTEEDADLDAVVAGVRERVDPAPEERERLTEAVDALTERVQEALADHDVTADVVQVGSTARGTWLAGDRDIDLFVRFPDELPREDLERLGLVVGRQVLPDGHEEFAEHPYVKGEFEGFDVDLVPCYDVPAATDIRSAVDRTPFHNAYLLDRLDDDLAGDVRVFKRFLKGIGVYGSDLRTKGFSGYLSELLVLEYGGFEPLLRAAADWQPPVEHDPEDHGTRTFDDPLVVVDPTDPERNVAAVLSADNVARLQHYARDLLADPREELFFPPERDRLSAEELEGHLDRRGTLPLAVAFDAPDVVEDQLYPQLEKSLHGVVAELDRRGFEPLRAASFASEGEDQPFDRAVLFVEVAIAELPKIQRHNGPPVHVRQHATGFYETYADSDVYGPFVDGDRYVVERDREFTTPESLLESDALFDVALGAQVKQQLKAEYEVLVGDDVVALTERFGVELRDYFDPTP
ncbi:tRNA nucleotidyltransferase (CCA-adding enzyme) [Halogranum gelatinilyticum]|uniref:CCA-adding enzyme n=1 Tax=Halogranum gelatinilyticum TaxID=660521 RepID=A0A1G9PSP1_9EURY|nr:CCA tRNA nucleotidyltransferase [Halogranum gelatinilyticum]SDM01247.1 tRNA nucleotidyltransferase (CCA-adding enzyme) [Halogranum gelatinilyticum]